MQLVVAEQMAQQLHVAGGVLGAHVGQHAARLLLAGVGVPLPRLEQGGHLVVAVVGVSSCSVIACAASASRQVTPALAPDPRGSKLTRS